jgi:tight adherence protein B
MTLQMLVVAFTAAVAIGGVAWVFLYPMLSGQRNADQRRAAFAKSEPVARRNDRAQRSRRQQVEDSLKEVEERTQKAKKVALTTRIAQAGLSWTKRKFIVISVVLGAVCFLVPLFVGVELLPSVGLGFAAGFGAPRWFLSHMKKRREKMFLDAFPDAVDVIVRGIKSGLPLFDSLKMVAADAQEPVKSEFAAIVETQAIGMPIGDACARLYERMPVSEANFFAIVITIQQKAGGNLSEALGNLSKVLRDRKKMKAKIRALSMESKASAAIIGSMPPLVVLGLYLMNPEYISIMWETDTGRMLLAGCIGWMTTGVLVMKKMISFDF